ncbi:hypothetical protein AX16_004681 [Volvariella volvacea WC 439]|nr:hypothetical protein AX16_004681 [Volvariella volvacea WC 439]
MSVTNNNTPSSTPRGPKSGNNWTTEDLLAYHIEVVSKTPAEFFGREPQLSLDHVNHQMLSDPIDAITNTYPDPAYHLLHYLQRASTPGMRQHPAINDFISFLLQTLGYTDGGSVTPRNYSVPMSTCGVSFEVEMDVCLLLLDSSVTFIVQVDLNSRNTEPQVIAEAIATYQHNNEIRRESSRSVLPSMTIPCVVMAGTRPTFYKVPVTEHLLTAVNEGAYPPQVTIVEKCEISSEMEGGMEVPDVRRQSPRYFSSKALVEPLWQDLRH